ncbi:MAG: hypothetical protein HY907_22130 [Deltaproteobacteria bacterium]|nr:hypothetical protein [Deltaproteobacteria bacterium]
MNALNNTVKEQTTMKRITLHLLGAVLLAGVLGACQESRGERSYVQTNVLRKDVLEGEWYYSRFVAEHNFESSYFTFRGDSTWDYATSTMARIRWIIDENYLYAVRTYEIVAGTNPDGGSSTFLGEPIAAFSIESHFDIQHQYNPTTGEVGIVTEENTRDRLWWERDYMRVDWTSNNVLGYYWASLDAYGELGYISRQPAGLLCDEGSECPASWQVQIATADCPASCRRAMHAPDGLEGDFAPDAEQCAGELGLTAADLGAIHPRRGVLTWADLAPWWTMGCQYVDELVDDPASGDAPPYYLSLVTQEIWSPLTAYGMMCDFAQGIPCTSFRVAVRHSFLRSTDVPDYEALNVPNSMYDRFGIIRLEQQTYQRGGLPDEEEGLTREYGATDALNYWGARHDLWADDLRLGPDGRRIPGDFRPLAQRAVKPIVYTLTAGFPTYLVEPSMRAAWEWNVTFMTLVRQARNQPLPSETGGVPWDCRIEEPDCAGCDPHTIADFDERDTLAQFTDEVYQHHFAGTECALILQTNPCDRWPNDDAHPCAELGDIRYHFWAMIVAPGAPFSGVSLPLQDVRNGRLVSANVNITKESIERISTSFLLDLGLAAPDELMHPDWSRWQVSEDAVMSGEYKREYFANLSNTEHPRGWAPIGAVAPRSELGAGSLYDPLLLVASGDAAGARARIEALRPKLERLTGMEGGTRTFSNRVFSLAGTQFERDTLDAFDTLGEYAEELPFGAKAVPGTLRATDEAVLDAVSPFRVSFAERIQQRRAEDLKRFDARHCFLPIDEFTVFSDSSLVRAATELGDYSPAQVAVEIRQRINKWVFMHEFGHSIGMEHNFGASADPLNYHDQYYEIASQHPYPDFGDYQTCETEPDPHTGERICSETAEDLAEFWADFDAVKRTRELAGVDSYHFTSVMDYPPEIYNYFHNVGRYDKAYALFAYAGRREVYEGDPRSYPARDDSAVPYGVCTPRDPSDINRGSDCTHECTEAGGTVTCPWLRRLPMVYYLGGERCEADSDCPFSRGKGTLAPGDPSRGIPAQEDVLPQKCVVNYRQRMLDADAAQLPKICSNFEEDWKRIGHTSYGTADAPFFPVNYKNCGNSRSNDISWCTMFDEGASFREVISNFRESFDRYYLMTHFRRYNNSWYGASIWRYLDTIGKIYQHFWYRLFYEGGEFRLQPGDPQFGYGDWDQFLASADAMEFLAYVITTPDVGSYDYDSITDSYLLKDTEEFGLGDLDVRPGLGKYMWSRYEDGLMGYFRLARQGMLRNKLEAMMALVLRDWGLTYGMDERYYFNFYDMFTVEMNSLFGGLMLDNPRWYGPRMTGTEAAPRLSYPQFWKGYACGGTLFGGGFPNYCAPDIVDQYPGSPAVGGGTNVILRNYAAAFALAEFPVFFDTSYEQQMYVALDGGGDYFEIPGCDVPAMLAAGALENDSCVVYESQRLHKTYVAAKFSPREPWLADYATLNYKSMAGELLHQMNELRELIGLLEDPTTPPADLPEECRTAAGGADCLLRAQGRLQDNESFTLSLIEMMHRYGISSWF